MTDNARLTRIEEKVDETRDVLMAIKGAFESLPARIVDIEARLAKVDHLQRTGLEWKDKAEPRIKQLEVDIIREGERRVATLERLVERWQTALSILGRTLQWLGAGGVMGLVWLGYEYLKNHSSS